MARIPLTARIIFSNYYSHLVDKIVEGLDAYGALNRGYGTFEFEIISLKNLFPNLKKTGYDYEINISMSIRNSQRGGAWIILKGLNLRYSNDYEIQVNQTTAKVAAYGSYLQVPSAYRVEDEKFTALGLAKMLKETIGQKRKEIVQALSSYDYKHSEILGQNILSVTESNLHAIYNELVDDGYGQNQFMQPVYSEMFDDVVRVARGSIYWLSGVSDTEKEEMKKAVDELVKSIENGEKQSGSHQLDPNFYNRLYAMMDYYLNSPALKFLFYIGLETCVEMAEFSSRNKTAEMIEKFKQGLKENALISPWYDSLFD
jgi:hypothetical protein